MWIYSFLRNKDNFFAVILAFFFCIPSINKIVVSIMPSFGGIFMSSCYLGVIIVLVFYVVFNKVDLRCNLFNFCVALFLIVAYLVTLSLNVISSELPVQFFIYVICPFFFFTTLPINVEVFVKGGMLLPSLGVFFYEKIFLLTYDSIAMGTSYAFLFPIICTFVYFFKSKEKNIFCSLLGSFNVIYLFQTIMHGSRGCLLCLVICLFMMFIFSKKDKSDGIESNPYKVVVSMLLVFLSMYFFIEIVAFLYSLFESFGFEIHFLEKIIRLHNLGDVTNGRAYIQSLTMADIIEKPWLGHGISTFDYYLGMDYPHNFILQMLYDLGVFGSLPLVFLIIHGTVIWYKKCNWNEYVLCVCICSSSIPAALFSGDLWRNALLWMTFGFFVSLHYKEFLGNESAVSKL